MVQTGYRASLKLRLGRYSTWVSRSPGVYTEFQAYWGCPGFLVQMEYQVDQVRLEKGATRGSRECPEKTAGKAIPEQLDLGEPLALLERWVPRVPRGPRDILVLRVTVVQEEHREDRVRWG